MKKIWFLLLTMIAALAIFPAYGWALNVSPADVSGSPGDEVVVSINISNVGGGLDVDVFGFTINFDQNVLTFVNADKTGTLSEPFSLVSGLEIAPGQVKVNGALFGTLVNISDDGVLVNLNFTVKATYKSSSLALTAFKDDISTAGTTDTTFTITGVTTTVAVTPALTTDVVAGQVVTFTAEVLINDAHLDLTSTDDITFVVTSGNGAMGAKFLTDGKVQVDYTTHTTIESATITATENVTGGVNQETAVVTSITGSLAALTVSPDAATLTADQMQQFTMTGVDANGNATDMGNITWSVNGGIGVIDSAGLFDATTVGTGSVAATSDIGGISDTTGDVIVTPGALVVLTVSPDTATLTADDTQQFAVTGVDADGNTADLGTITWSVVEGSGTIDATGLFDPASVGTGTVTATSSHGPVDSSGNITVSHGAATKMTLNASKTTIASDTKGSATLTATILDQNDNVVTTDNSTVVTFTLTDGTYLSLSSSTDKAENGVAEVTVTSKAGTLANPPVTDGTNITSLPVLSPPTADPDVILTIVNFSINVDAPAATFVDGIGVHLVTSGSTPYQATFTGLGSTTGDYRWALSGVGEISSTTADSITYTAPSSIEGDNQTAILTLTSATDGALTDDIAITTYNPVSITSPASAAGIAIGDTTKGVTVIGGTGMYKFQSSDTAVATVDADGGGVTPVAAGNCQIQVRDVTYGDFATENGFYAVSPQIEIVNPITVTPATKSLNASDSQTFAASGGKAGGYIWICDNADAGTIDETTGIFTAADVTATQTATITAMDGYDIEGTATITVYPTLKIAETPPTVLAGKSFQLSVAGGDENYTWTVIGPDGISDVSLDVLDSITGNSVTFTAPTDDYGEYRITVDDTSGNNIDGVLYTVTVVPIPARITGTVKVGNFLLTQLTDDSYTIKVTQQDGTAYDPVAEDTDGLDTADLGDLYIIDVPIYDDFQPGGANPGDTAVIHIYIGDSELEVISPEDGKFTVGDSDSDTIINIEAVTQPPTANAGTDQDVVEGVTVTLNGLNSSDPDDGIASYSWTQTAGDSVILSDPMDPEPTFTSPEVGVDGKSLTFELEVTDTGGLKSTKDSCIVNVTGVNVSPTADAGIDQTVDEGVAVTLDGSDSSDPNDGDVVSYIWTQTAGTSVTLSDPTVAEPTFTSPDVGVAGESLTFELEVTDIGGLKSTDTCIVNVTWVNISPTADAGIDQSVYEGVTVTLDGSNSYDSDDGIASYSWTQTNVGTSVILSDPTAAELTFVSPPVDADGVELTFQLEVSDNGGLLATDEVSVTVEDNGITDFDDLDVDIFTFKTSTNKNVGVKVDSGGNVTSLKTVNPDTIADTANMPNNLIYGLIDLQIKTETHGETVKVTVCLSEPVPDDYRWYKYGPTKGWYDFTSNVEFNSGRDQVTLTLVDGGAGDDDGTANGVIVDPSGPGSPPTDIVDPSGHGSPPTDADKESFLSDTSNDDRCFVATAAYGSPFESHVKILRNFRDAYLLTTRLGHAFVDTYYKYSPDAAAFIADHEFLRAVVRVGLMPVVGISYLALHTTAAQKALIIFLMFSLLAGGYLSIRRLKARKIVTA